MRRVRRSAWVRPCIQVAPERRITMPMAFQTAISVSATTAPLSRPSIGSPPSRIGTITSSVIRPTTIADTTMAAAKLNDPNTAMANETGWARTNRPMRRAPSAARVVRRGTSATTANATWLRARGRRDYRKRQPRIEPRSLRSHPPRPAKAPGGPLSVMLRRVGPGVGSAVPCPPREGCGCFGCCRPWAGWREEPERCGLIGEWLPLD
jgi:hypothetical protein